MDLDLYGDEEVSEREAEMERLELGDQGYWDGDGLGQAPLPGHCDLCLGHKDGTHPTLCIGCVAYTDWHDEHFGAES
jgi:hypothetical protein